MLGCGNGTIAFSTDAMRASLLRLENDWEIVQASRGRDAIYGYLSTVYELVEWWAQEGKQSNVLVGRCTCGGIRSLGSRSLSQASSVARPIRIRSMTGPLANGRGCCATLQNVRIWMSRCGISSSERAVSTNVPRGLSVTSGDTDNAAILVAALVNIPVGSGCRRLVGLIPEWRRLL